MALPDPRRFDSVWSAIELGIGGSEGPGCNALIAEPLADGSGRVCVSGEVESKGEETGMGGSWCGELGEAAVTFGGRGVGACDAPNGIAAGAGGLAVILEAWGGEAGSESEWRILGLGERGPLSECGCDVVTVIEGAGPLPRPVGSWAADLDGRTSDVPSPFARLCSVWLEL